MSGYTVPSREEDPVQVVRTIGRVAHMLMELRDEYVERQRPEILEQIEQRVDDLIALRDQLHQHVDKDESHE